MLKSFIYFLSLLMLFSCGKNADQKTADAILSANIALSKGNCQNAINVLEENGRVNDNAAYLKTLASAYACRAGYSTLTFFTTDISKTVTPAPLGGTTTYSTSSAAVQSTLQNDSSYSDLQTAINILLYAGGIPSGTEPTTTERKKYFTSSEVADIDSQLLYMVMVQLGHYMYFYGDSSATGVKGSGAGTNNCFSDYSSIDGGGNGNVTAILNALPGSCKVKNSPHAQLNSGAVSAATRKTRLCQGVILLNGVIALLPNVIASAFPAADQAAALAAVAAINAAKSALSVAYPAIGSVLTTLNQSICEDNAIVPVESIESYYAGFFEAAFQ